MKIRIKGNSVRIRLSKSEVTLFAKEGVVEETTEFNDTTFIYGVKSTDAETLSAEFVNGNITLFVPKHLLQQWASTSVVSLEHTMPLENGKDLSLLLEKDFKCIDAVAKEDQSDYFENPAKSC